MADPIAKKSSEEETAEEKELEALESLEEKEGSGSKLDE